MNLRRSYTLLAPIYDAGIARLTDRARQRSLAALPAPAGNVLLAGVGTGLDLPYLPRQHTYTGIDLTRAMLGRALPRATHLRFDAIQGDVQRLPFADASFDAAILHLILAVVPSPEHCLAEIARVVRPGGTVLIYDKFLRPGQHAVLRRLLNPLVRRIATRLDVVFEPLLAATPTLSLIDDTPALAGGWFRLIRLRRH